MSIFTTPTPIGFTPIIATTIGALGAYTINQAFYFVNGVLVIVFLDFTITNNGTGAGVLTATPPVPITNLFAWGNGREVVNTGKMVGVAGANLSPIIGIFFYDNTYAGGLNARIRCGWTQA